LRIVDFGLRIIGVNIRGQMKDEIHHFVQNDMGRTWYVSVGLTSLKYR
jgi:hypothetical protein